MLLSAINNDNEEVRDLSSEGTVDPAIQAEVPLDLHATLPTCQERTGMRQPIQTMAVTRQSTASGRDRVTQTKGEISRESAGWGAPRDEHEDHPEWPMRACKPSCCRTGRSDGVSINRAKVPRGDGDQRHHGCEPPTTINHQAPETVYAFNLLWPSSTVYACYVCGRQLIRPYNGYTVRCCSATGNRHSTVG